MLREILVENGVSPSLSYTDRAQSEIDRPFARVLRCAWQALPVPIRGQSSDALIARARTLRSHKAIPSKVLDEAAGAGRELTLILQASDPAAMLDAVRHTRDGLASGEIAPSTKITGTLPSPHH